MIPAPPHVLDALTSLQAMLAADGYELSVGEQAPGALVAEIRAGPEACADCLVPKDLMRVYFEQALRPVCELGLPQIALIYPGEAR